MCQLGERWPGARVGRGILCSLVLLCVLVQAATPAVAPLVLRIVVGLGAGMVTQSACVAGQCDQVVWQDSVITDQGSSHSHAF